MQTTGSRLVLGCVAAQAIGLALVAVPVEASTVAGGTTHTLVVRTTDSTVWAWGVNSDGQLGDNTTTQRKTAIQTSGLSGVVAVAAGAKHSLALTSAGVLWAWGDNYYGQIGNANNTDQRLPVQVLTGVSQVGAGDYHTIALKSDGSLWIWGANNEGQLGDGGTTNRNTPYQVTGLGLVNAIVGGGNHTLAILAAGGSLKAWGKNTNGQLGDGSTYARATSPVSVAAVLNATSPAGGYAFSLARLFDGTLYAWGYNSNGQLGFGDTTQRSTPALLSTPTSVVAIATGGSHVLALLSDGSLVAWGHNTYGSVGDGSDTQRTSPVAVTGLSSLVAVGAGQYHSVAVTSAGAVWAWGRNNSAQLGRRHHGGPARAGPDRGGRLQLESRDPDSQPRVGHLHRDLQRDDRVRHHRIHDPLHHRRERPVRIVHRVLLGGRNHRLDHPEGQGLQDGAVGQQGHRGRLHLEGSHAEREPRGRHVHDAADGVALHEHAGGHDPLHDRRFRPHGRLCRVHRPARHRDDELAQGRRLQGGLDGERYPHRHLHDELRHPGHSDVRSGPGRLRRLRCRHDQRRGGVHGPLHNRRVHARPDLSALHGSRGPDARPRRSRRRRGRRTTPRAPSCRAPTR